MNPRENCLNHPYKNLYNNIEFEGIVLLTGICFKLHLPLSALLEYFLKTATIHCDLLAFFLERAL